MNPFPPSEDDSSSNNDDGLFGDENRTQYNSEPPSIEVIRAAQIGDNWALDQLMQYAIPIIKKQASGFAQPTVGYEFDDLVQEGSIGVLNSIGKYDPARGRLRTFIRTCVRNAMIDYIWQRARIIALPRGMSCSLAAIKTEISKFESKFNREPTAEEIAGEIGLSGSKVEELLEIDRQFQVRSLDELDRQSEVQNSGEHQDPENLPESIIDSILKPSSRDSLNREDYEVLKMFVGKLTPRQREVMTLRYGLHDGIWRTQQEVANLIGVTKARVGEIEKNLLAKLRLYLGGL
jgi:RNA polymerase primary sigma factor